MNLRLFGFSSVYETFCIHIKDKDNENYEALQTLANNYHSQNQNRNVNTEAANYAMQLDMQRLLNIEQCALSLAFRETIYIDWPYLKESKIVCVETELFHYQLPKYGPINDETITTKQKQTEKDKQMFQRQVNVYKNHFLSMYGIDVGNINILVTARPLIGINKRFNHDLKKFESFKEYSKQTMVVPKQLIVLKENLQNVDLRHEIQLSFIVVCCAVVLL